MSCLSLPLNSTCPSEHMESSFTTTASGIKACGMGEPSTFSSTIESFCSFHKPGNVQASFHKYAEIQRRTRQIPASTKMSRTRIQGTVQQSATHQPRLPLQLLLAFGRSWRNPLAHMLLVRPGKCEREPTQTLLLLQLLQSKRSCRSRTQALLPT